MEEDFQQLHTYVDHRNYKDAENSLRCMQNIFEKDYHETVIDEYLLNAFDEKHGLIEFITKTRNIKEFSDAIAESLEILHVLVNRLTEKVIKYALGIREICIRVVLTNKPSSKTKTRALELLSTILEKTNNFPNDQSIEELYERLNNIYRFNVNEKTSSRSVLAITIKALYTLIRKYYEKLNSVDMLCSSLLSHLVSNVKKSEHISETEQIFRFFDNYLCVNESYVEYKSLYTCVQHRLEVDCAVKTSHVAALEFLQHHSNLYQEEIYNNSKIWEKILTDYLKHTGEIKKSAYYTLDALYETLAVTTVNKNAKDSCAAHLKKFTKYINDENNHGYELRLSIRGFGYFAKSFKTHLSKDIINTAFLNMILRIEKLYLLDFDRQSEQLNYLPDYVQTLSKIVEQLDDVSHHEIIILQKSTILLIRLSPYLSAHHPDFVVNPIVIAFSLVRRFQRELSKRFLQNVISEGIMYSASHPLAYDLDDINIITYKNYLPLWINLVNKNIKGLGIPIEESEKMLEEIYDELVRTLISLISKLNLNIQKVEENEAQCDPRVSLEAVKVPDFNIFVNMIDLYVELLKAAPKTKFSKCVKRFLDFSISQSKMFPLVSGFYKLIAVALEICNSLKYFSPTRLQRNDIKSYYETIDDFINSILPKIEIYKDDLKLSCMKVVLAAPEMYVKKNLNRLSPAIISLFVSSRSNLTVVMSGINTLETWCQFLPHKEYDEFLCAVVPTLDSYLRSKVLTEGIDTSNVKQRKQKQAIYKRNIASVEEGDLLQLQKKILSFLGNVSGNVCRSLIEVNNKIDQVSIGENLNMKIVLNYDTKISIYLEKFLPRIIDLALHCSERKLQITACETLHAVVIIFLGTSRIHDDKKELDCQFKKMFYPLLQLGCFPDTTVQQLIKPLVDQLIHWYTSHQGNSSKLAIVIECLLEGVTQREDTALRDFSCHCIHELVKYSLKHCVSSDDELSNVKIVIRKIKQFCYHSDPVRRLAGSLIFNNTYTLLREEKVIVDIYWLELFQSLLYNLSQIEENDEYDSLLHTIQSIDHLERVFKEKANIFNKSSKRRKIPNGFLDGTLNSVISTALNYRCAKNRKAKARIYQFYYHVSLHISNKPNKITFPPYIIADPFCQNSGDKNALTFNNILNFLKKLLFILDTELAIYEHEKCKHSYKVDEKLLRNLEYYFEKLNPYNLKAINTIHNFNTTDYDGIVFKNLKFELSKCGVQYLIIASFYENYYEIQTITKKYGIKLLLDFLFGNTDSLEGLEDQVILNLLSKIANMEYVTLLTEQITEYISKNHLIVGDLDHNVSRKQKTLLKGMSLLRKSSLNENINIGVYFKDILENILNKLVNPITNYTIKITADIKKYCQLAIELYAEQKDVTFLLNCISDQNEVHDLVKNENTTFGFYLYTTFKDTLLPILLENSESVLHLLKPHNDIYFFTNEILNYINSNKKKINPTYIIATINTIISNWSMYKHFYICKELDKVTEGLKLLETIVELSSGIEIFVSDDVITWILSCFEFSNFNVLPQRLYRHLEQILSALPLFSNTHDFVIFKEVLDIIRNNYFTEISLELQDAATIVVNKAFQISVMTQSTELFVFSCDIYIKSKLRNCINIQEYTKMFIIIVSKDLQYSTLEKVYENAFSEFTESSMEFADLIVTNLLRYCSYEVFEKFYIERIKEVLLLLNVPDDTKENVIKKSVAYILVKCLFSKINTNNFEDKSCPITKAANVTTGLVKNLFVTATNYLKEKNDESSELKEYVRICKCHSYNALISIISNGIKNNDSNRSAFYDRLFYRAADGENILWKNLIDLSKHYEFPLIFDQLPTKTTRLVNIRTRNQGQSALNYIESQTLYSSTLSEDVRKYDFAKTIIRSQQSETSYAQSENEVEMQITVEGEEINSHECMANICGLIRQIHIDKIYEGCPSAKWVEHISSDLKSENTHINIKLFLLKIIEKEQEIFKPFSKLLTDTIIHLIVNKVVGGEINYFVGDLIIMLTYWGDIEVNEQNSKNISKLVLFLMVNTNRERVDIKKYHLNLLKLVVESWKEHITIPIDYIFSELDKLGKSKKLEVIIHFCSIFLANSVVPWGDDLNKFAGKLVSCLQSESVTVQRTCSETIGMALKLAEEKSHPEINKFTEAVIKKVKSFNLGKYLTCLEGFMHTFPVICDALLNTLIGDFHRTPRSKHVALQIFSDRTEILHENASFPLLQFEQLINNYDDALNILGLDVIRKTVSKIQIDQQEIRDAKIKFTKTMFISLMENIAKFSNNNNRVCRSAMYDVFIEIYSNINNNDIQNFSANVLLKGLSDADEEVQIKIVEFFNGKLTTNNISSKFLLILKNMYKPELEDHFLGYTIKFLSKELDTSVILFDTPLQDSNFSERFITDNWRGRHSSYVPLFASTYQSQASNSFGTQGVGSKGSFNLRATAMEVEFEPTYQPGTIAFEKQELLQSMQGNEGQEDVFKVPLPVDRKVLKKRFQKDTSKVERQIALGHLTKKERTARERIDKMKQRQEKATIYRKYRDGEIPDIQICLADLIIPLGQLMQHDAHIAEIFYTSFFHGILHNGNEQVFLTETAETIQTIFKSSISYNSYLMSALLNVVVKIPGQAFSPSIITRVALNSGLLSSGILVLEEYLLQECDQDAEIPAKRNPTSNPKLKIWVKLADLYRELQDWDTVKAIFLEKMDCNEDIVEAINYESQGHWWQAEDCYIRLLQKDLSLDRRDFYYESYFKCFAEMSNWQKMSDAIQRATSDNVWEDLWDKNWNQEKLLPWYILAETRNSIESPTKMKQFTHTLNKAMMDSEKLTYLKQHFSEEIGFLHLINENPDKALYYIKHNLEQFLEIWQNTSPVLVSLRANKLTKITNTIDIYNFINQINRCNQTVLQNNALQLGKQWQKVTQENTSSIIPLETRHIYRMKCLNTLQDKLGDLKATWEQIKFDGELAMLQTAVNMKNYYVARKYLCNIRNNLGSEKEDNVEIQLAYAKMVMLKASYLPAESKDLYKYVEGAYREIESSISSTESLNIKLSVASTIYDILFNFAKSVHLFQSQTKELIPDLSNCTEIGLKEYAATKMRNILDMCGPPSTSELPLIADAYTKLAYFYNSTQHYSEHLVISVLRAMYYGSEEGRQMFPCLLDIKDVGIKYKDLFVKELKNLPEWLFIQWIPQLLSKLDSDCIFIIDKMILRIALLYPQAIMYAYKLSKEKYDMNINNNNIKSRLNNILKELDQLLANETADNLIEALTSVASAKSIVMFHITNLLQACLLKNSELFNKYMENLDTLCKRTNTYDSSSKIGAVHKRIVELSKDTLKLKKEQFKPDTLLDKLECCKQSLKNIDDSGKRLFEFKLSYYSPYLELFMDNQLENNVELEIPGQYKGDTKPLPQYHIKIAGFSPEVLLMHSLRKPIRIKIIGNDGKEHMFLVKVGEDLRQDQRIQQMFSLMNGIFNSNAMCRERRLKLSTYQVIPLTPNLGLIEWVENTLPLRQFLFENASDNMEKRLDAIKKRHQMRYAFPQPVLHHKALKKHKPEVVALIYQELVNMIPQDVLRKALKTLSVNSESFIAIRNTFITSYVSTCIANWILGIGDRHLNNTLLCLKNGSIIDIDFGHAFGSGVQVQGIPELVPFRLTPHIVSLMQPLEEHGLIEQTMVHVLKALCENHNCLISTVKVFVNEPSMDWVQYKKFKNRTMGYNWCAEEKIRHTEMKLTGACNSAEIMIEELRKKPIDTEYIEKYVEYVRGTPRNIRSKLTGQITVEQQVKCLLDHATDPNLLCRMFCGWEAWV